MGNALSRQLIAYVNLRTFTSRTYRNLRNCTSRIYANLRKCTISNTCMISLMSCHDDIRSMCCVQIKSNMQDGLDRIQFNWIIHSQITNLRGAPKAPHSGAKRRPPPKAVGPRAPLGPRTLGRPTLQTAA